MPDFAYIARDNTGKKVSGTLCGAESARSAGDLGKASALSGGSDRRQTCAGGAHQQGRKVKATLMAVTYAQLADLLRSGVPLLRSLEVLKQQTSHAGLKAVMDDVYTKVEDGTNLADAMQQHPRAFGEMAVSMVRAGGEGGFLEDALARVAQFTEQQQDLKARTEWCTGVSDFSVGGRRECGVGAYYFLRAEVRRYVCPLKGAW